MPKIPDKLKQHQAPPAPPAAATQQKEYPTWTSPCGGYTLICADNMDVMRGVVADTIDSVVSDPPYGLEFMGKDWDAPWKNQVTSDHLGGIEVCDEGTHASHPFRDGTKRITYGRSPLFQVWCQEWAAELLRISKPGAHCAAFGGTRMWHRLACGVEDAGWDVRDTAAWVYGSGFPKSHDISKAIDRELGELHNREIISQTTTVIGVTSLSSKGVVSNVTHSKPATAAAAEWNGWGTALKPSYEPVIIARKPLVGTVAQNVMRYGTGGINVDGCRVGVEDMPVTPRDGQVISENRAMAAPNTGRIDCGTKTGRWPANLAHDGSDEVVRLFPEAGGGDNRGKCDGKRNGGFANIGADKGDSIPNSEVYADSGSAARFFYCSKASSDDRGYNGTHPTVKPVDLMCWLVRLVTRKGGLVTDPFMGSGTTGVACVREGMRFIGIVKNPEYWETAVGRVQRALMDAGKMAKPKMGEGFAPTQLKIGRK